MRLIGVDTGIRGAYAILSEDLRIIEVGNLPTIGSTKKYLDIPRLKSIFQKADHIYIEKAQPFPKQGIVSTGRLMESFGIIQGLACGLSIPYTVISPVSWKKEMLQGMPKDKSSSLIRVKQLYPDIDLKKTEHHKADAILIAIFGSK